MLFASSTNVESGPWFAKICMLFKKFPCKKSGRGLISQNLEPYTDNFLFFLFLSKIQIHLQKFKIWKNWLSLESKKCVYINVHYCLCFHQHFLLQQVFNQIGAHQFQCNVGLINKLGYVWPIYKLCNTI